MPVVLLIKKKKRLFTLHLRIVNPIWLSLIESY